MAIVQVRESLRARIGDVLAPLRAADALPPGWSLGGFEVEQGITLRFVRAEADLTVELEAADSERPCFARTRRFNIYYAGNGRRDLDPDERDLLNRVVALLRAREGRLPLAVEANATSKRVAVREVQVERALVPEGRGAYHLNPYVGCLLGCSFCYAMHRTDFSRALDGLPRAEWGKWVDVKVNAPAVVAAEVARLAPGVVRMSPIVTDPYQPLERRYRITRGCIRAMVGTGFVPAVLTRASAVLDDLELLASFPTAFVGVSVPTDDDEVRAAAEPGTEPIDARVATLKALHEAGLTTFAIIQPMLPLDPARVVDALAPWVRAVRIGPLFEKERIEAALRRIGRTGPLDEGWERATAAELAARFSARGVLVNPAEGAWGLLA